MPRTQDEIVEAASAVSLPIPDACMPGVIANLALLDSHAEILLGADRETP